MVHIFFLFKKKIEKRGKRNIQNSRRKKRFQDNQNDRLKVYSIAIGMGCIRCILVYQKHVYATVLCAVYHVNYCFGERIGGIFPHVCSVLRLCKENEKKSGRERKREKREGELNERNAINSHLLTLLCVVFVVIAVVYENLSHIMTSTLRRWKQKNACYTCRPILANEWDCYHLSGICCLNKFHSNFVCVCQHIKLNETECFAALITNYKLSITNQPSCKIWLEC